MKNLYHFLVTIIFLLFLSCDVNESTYTSSNILPLSVGNYWDYQLIQYKYDQVDSSIIYLDSSLVRMSVVKKDTLESFIGYHIDNYLIYLGWDITDALFSNKEDGLYIARISGIFLPTPPPVIEKALSYPTFVGDSTTFNNYIIRTSKLDETVKVPSGTFICIVYEVFADNILVGKLWLKPNVGLVKYWQLFGISNLDYELQSYQIK